MSAWTFVRAVPFSAGVELLFSDGTLITVFTASPDRGTIAVGSIARDWVATYSLPRDEERPEPSIDELVDLMRETDG